MRRLPRLPLLLGLVLASCLDGTAPRGREVTISFCGTPAWAGYRNEGEPWRQLAVPIDVIRVPDRVVIAWVNQWGTEIHVEHFTADQAATAHDCRQDAQPVGKLVQTSVSGVDAVDQVYAVLGPAVAHRTGDGLLHFGVPAGPQDLVAARQIFGTNSERAQGVIVRRGLDVASGTILPPLDFASAEAVVPLEHTITLTDTDGAGYRGLQVEFMTATAGLVRISGIGWANPTVTASSLPSSILAPGDLHMMSAGASAPGLLFHRSFNFFYRTGADRTLSLGPTPNAPVFTTPPPGVVVRANLSSQPEYSAFVWLRIWAGDRSVYFTATREYFGGTPETWSLDLPELGDAPGFQEAWGFTATSASWHLIVTGQPWGFRPNKDAHDGDLLRTASFGGPEVQLPPAP